MKSHNLFFGIAITAVVAIGLVWLLQPVIKPGSKMDPKKIITRETIEGMFSNIRAKGQWKIDGDMLWGYFFINSTKEPLENAAKKLEEKGYRVVDVQPVEKTKTWMLHVEKVETHTVDSLYQRDLELYQFAEDMKLDSYDGMDVGPVSP